MGSPRSGLTVFLVLTAGGAWAQLSPTGDELQINTYATSSQERPRVAADAAGNFVVVWQSLGSGGTDTSGLSIQGQRFGPSGQTLGGEFQVNSYTTSEQNFPRVAAHAAGDFLVTWRSLGSFGTDTSGDSVQAQRFDSNGVPVASQFQVNTYTTYIQAGSAVAFDGSADFVIVWAGWAPSASMDIDAQRYDASGTPLGGEFLINAYTINYQLRPTMAADAAGNFVVVWDSLGSSGSDTSFESIQARRYDANGDPLGDQFQVNTYTTNGQRSPAIAMDSLGNFVVVWGSLGSGGSDTSDMSVQARRYGSNGLPLGGEFQINTYTTGFQGNPYLAADAAGNFVAAWTSAGSTGSDNSSNSIQARHFGSDGTPRGGEVQVNTYTTNAQENAAVSTDGQGHFVVAWQSYGSSGADSDGWSIQAQRFDAAFFGDGFETGDTSRWSATVP